MRCFPVSGPSLRRALLCTSAFFLIHSSLAVAADVTVPPNRTDTVVLTDDGDTLKVEKGGWISRPDRAVSARANNQTVINEGTIRSRYSGIHSHGNSRKPLVNLNIINRHGASIEGNHGITLIYRKNARITNSSGASIKGESSGIYFSDGHDVAVNNSSGAIIEGGRNGINFLSSDETKITNSSGATIKGGQDGIDLYASDKARITNAGTIIGGASAINVSYRSNDATLNLLAGSVLVGSVVFNGSNPTLEIGKGLNLYLKYEDNDPTVTSAVPNVHDKAGNVVYTIDPSGLALSQSFIQTTAGAVHDAVRTGAGRGNAFGGGFSGSGTYGYGSDEPGFDRTGRRFWACGFGGYQSQNGSGNIAGGDQAYGGLVTGGGFASQERMYGGFAGGAYSRLQTDNGTQAVDAASFVAGVYGGTRSGAAWISGSLLGGYTSFSSDRTVADNTAVGGLRTASADYDGYFISPSVTIGRSLGERTEVSIGGHYAGLFIDGYTETGLPTNMTVASRDVHVASLRAKAGYLALQHRTDNGTMSMETWAGVDGYFNLGGGDVSASVAGLPIDAFSANFEDATAAGFTGIGLNSKSADGTWSFNASLEGRYGTRDFTEVRAKATAAKKF